MIGNRNVKSDHSNIASTFFNYRRLFAEKGENRHKNKTAAESKTGNKKEGEMYSRGAIERTQQDEWG